MGQKVYEMAGKWGTDVAERGFAQVPNYLLFINSFRGEEDQLSPLEILLLVQLVGAWWKRNEMPFPSVKTLSQRCGTSDRQVLRAMASLEKANLLRRVKRRQKGLIRPNAYDLQPLVDALEEIADKYPNAFPRKVRSEGVKEGLPASDVATEGEQPPERRKVRRGRVSKTAEE